MELKHVYPEKAIPPYLKLVMKHEGYFCFIVDHVNMSSKYIIGVKLDSNILIFEFTSIVLYGMVHTLTT